MTAKHPQPGWAPDQLTATWQSASLLLGYPDARLEEQLPIVREAATRLPSRLRTPLLSVADHLERVAAALPSRVPRSRWGSEPALRALPARSNVLTVPITALDGRQSGLLQLAEKGRGDFTEADEAIALHLADMAAAALERAELYRRHARV